MRTIALGVRSSKDARIEYPLKYERKENRIQLIQQLLKFHLYLRNDNADKYFISISKLNFSILNYIIIYV